MLRDETADWAIPEIDLPDEGGASDLHWQNEAIETIILRRPTRLQAEADSLILIEIHRDLLGAYVVTRSSASTARAPRSVATPCANWDEAMIEAGSRVHRALCSGYRFYKETTFSSRL
jgi:hypothetical protein